MKWVNEMNDSFRYWAIYQFRAKPHKHMVSRVASSVITDELTVTSSALCIVLIVVNIAYRINRSEYRMAYVIFDS